MSIEKYFDRIYCINLVNRGDRWEACEAEFKKHKIAGIVRFEAIKGIPKNVGHYGTMGLNPSAELFEKKLEGRIGCLLSHLAIIQQSKKEGLGRILILEDDVQFIKGFKTKFSKISPQIPATWSLLYLGGNEKSYQSRISENVLRVSNMLMAHAIGIDNSVFDLLIEKIQKCELPVDVYYAELQKTLPCYSVYPYLAWQRAGWSDLEQRYRIYDFEHPSEALQQILKCKTGDT